jgi:phenylpyruvate tautomerase PptA (4-oxalocrotonate tautomerase family)
MPLVNVTLRKPKSPEFKSRVLDSVHGALTRAGVPQADLFQRVFELDAGDFRYDPSYPDLARARTDDYVLIEILWSVGRSVKVKRQLLGDLVESLRAGGIDPENVMVVFKETGWENWAFGGGRLLHA